MIQVADRRTFWQKLRRKPIIKRRHWSLDHSGQILLFGVKGIASDSPFTLAMLAKYYNRMLIKIKETKSPMIIKSMMIDEFVAIDLILNGDITLQMLLNADEDRYAMYLKDFKLGDHTVTLEIRNNMYYEYYQFHVSNHPEGYEVVRDVPDLLAAVAGETV